MVHDSALLMSANGKSIWHIGVSYGNREIKIKQQILSSACYVAGTVYKSPKNILKIEEMSY